MGGSHKEVWIFLVGVDVLGDPLRQNLIRRKQRDNPDRSLSGFAVIDDYFLSIWTCSWSHCNKSDISNSNYLLLYIPHVAYRDIRKISPNKIRNDRDPILSLVLSICENIMFYLINNLLDLLISNHLYLSWIYLLWFYRQFRICITTRRAKPIPLVGRCLGAAVA